MSTLWRTSRELVLVNDNSRQQRCDKQQRTHAPANSVSVVMAQKEPSYIQRQQMATVFSHFRGKPALHKCSSAINMLLFHKPHFCPTFSSP